MSMASVACDVMCVIRFLNETKKSTMRPRAFLKQTDCQTDRQTTETKDHVLGRVMGEECISDGPTDGPTPVQKCENASKKNYLLAKIGQ